MRRPGPLLGVLAVFWLAALAAALAFGPQPLVWRDLWAPSSATATIFWQLRLPRALMSLLAGGGLAVGGASFQTLFRNPLAEPYTLGVAGGAALGAVLAQQWLPASLHGSFPWVGAATFSGALLVTLLLIGLSSSRRGVRTQTLLLAGIAISFSCSALILFVQYLADYTKTFRMVRWMMGGLAVVGYREVAWVAIWVVVGCVVLLALRWDLNQLITGEEMAASRGVDLSRLRLLVLIATSGMVGAIVAACGPIGFVGLVVPHIVRRWSGVDHLVLLPASLLAGGGFLALCDVIARWILAPAELPVGVLTALLGGPFFLWVLIQQRRSDTLFF